MDCTMRSSLVHASDRCRDVDGRLCGGAGNGERWSVLKRRKTLRAVQKALKISGEKFWRLPVDDEYRDMIVSDIGDIRNTGGALGRGDYGGHVPEGICRRHAVDASRYCWGGVDGRAEALDRQRPLGDRRAQHCGVGAELRSAMTVKKVVVLSASKDRVVFGRPRDPSLCSGWQYDGSSLGLFWIATLRPALRSPSSPGRESALAERPRRLPARVFFGWDRSRSKCGGDGRSC